MNIYYRCRWHQRLILFTDFSVFDIVVDNGDKFIGGDNNTSNKFTAGDKNKDAMGVGSFQG